MGSENTVNQSQALQIKLGRKMLSWQLREKKIEYYMLFGFIPSLLKSFSFIFKKIMTLAFFFLVFDLKHVRIVPCFNIGLLG